MKSNALSDAIQATSKYYREEKMLLDIEKNLFQPHEWREVFPNLVKELSQETFDFYRMAVREPEHFLELMAEEIEEGSSDFIHKMILGSIINRFYELYFALAYGDPAPDSDPDSDPFLARAQKLYERVRVPYLKVIK